MPDTVNILLTHNPNPDDFCHVAELGIDLTLAGHTDGGQLSLEFLRRGVSFARLETPYVSGRYEKSGSQLYVNRGIGTIVIPSASAPARKSRYWNWCGESKMRFGNVPTQCASVVLSLGPSWR